MRQNVRVRALLITLVVSIVAVCAAGVGVDFGTAIYAEYQMSRALRAEAGLGADPWVGILGFPFVTQALRHRYGQMEIKVTGADHALVDKATLEATLYSIDLSHASWLVRPNAALPAGKVESRIIIDSSHLGRYMGINDLMIEAPPKETNDATGGTTASGISSSHGLVFTGTPKSADFNHRVSVSVDLSVSGSDDTTLDFTGTGIITGAGTADRQVPDDKKDAVLAAFTKSLPGQRLPFAIAPTREGARGSDVIIEGVTQGVTVSMSRFRQS
jgi:LmeA-like phospholipid-binding